MESDVDAVLCGLLVCVVLLVVNEAYESAAIDGEDVPTVLCVMAFCGMTNERVGCAHAAAMTIDEYFTILLL